MCFKRIIDFKFGVFSLIWGPKLEICEILSFDLTFINIRGLDVQIGFSIVLLNSRDDILGVGDVLYEFLEVLSLIWLWVLLMKGVMRFRKKGMLNLDSMTLLRFWVSGKVANKFFLPPSLSFVHHILHIFMLQSMCQIILMCFRLIRLCWIQTCHLRRSL